MIYGLDGKAYMKKSFLLIVCACLTMLIAGCKPKVVSDPTEEMTVAETNQEAHAITIKLSELMENATDWLGIDSNQDGTNDHIIMKKKNTVYVDGQEIEAISNNRYAHISFMGVDLCKTDNQSELIVLANGEYNPDRGFLYIFRLNDMKAEPFYIQVPEMKNVVLYGDEDGTFQVSNVVIDIPFCNEAVANVQYYTSSQMDETGDCAQVFAMKPGQKLSYPKNTVYETEKEFWAYEKMDLQAKHVTVRPGKVRFEYTDGVHWISAITDNGKSVFLYFEAFHTDEIDWEFNGEFNEAWFVPVQ